jgi:threonine/homoserine/homoserine lactone efflux protein
MKIFSQQVFLVVESSAKFRLSLFATFITPTLILFFGSFLLDWLTGQGEYSPIAQAVAGPIGHLVMGLSLLSFAQLAAATIRIYQRERDRMFGLRSQG